MTDHEHHWSNLCDADTDCWAERDDEISSLREQLEAAQRDLEHEDRVVLELAEAKHENWKRAEEAWQLAQSMIPPEALEAAEARAKDAESKYTQVAGQAMYAGQQLLEAEAEVEKLRAALQEFVDSWPFCQSARDKAVAALAPTPTNSGEVGLAADDAVVRPDEPKREALSSIAPSRPPSIYPDTWSKGP